MQEATRLIEALKFVRLEPIEQVCNEDVFDLWKKGICSVMKMR